MDRVSVKLQAVHGQDHGTGHDLVLQLVVVVVIIIDVNRQFGSFEAAAPQAARPTSGRMQRRSGREHRQARVLMFQVKIRI